MGNGDDATFARTFTVTVNDVNQTPTLTAISNPAAINENASVQTVNLSGISAGPGDTQTLQVTATSDLTSVIPNPTVTYTSAQRHRLDQLHTGRQHVRHGARYGHRTGCRPRWHVGERR